MTLSLLETLGITSSFKDNTITVPSYNSNLKAQTLTVESDWSSVSYYYSIVALSEVGTTFKLSSYKEYSLQGDAVLVQLYEKFGVSTRFENNTIVLTKSASIGSNEKISFDLSNAPDIAQTIAVTSYGLGLECYLTGLHTLKIKETDRLVALKTELEKFGAVVDITNDSLHLNVSNTMKSDVTVATYNDHRMAMAFAPLGLSTTLVIENADVVSKSYPDFWSDLRSIGFSLK